MTFNPGRARHRITLESKAAFQNEIGEPVKSWAPIGETWAVITQAEGSESWAAGADQFVNLYMTSFEIRYRRSIAVRLGKEEMRVRWQGRTFRVLSIIDPGERRYQFTIRAEQVQEAAA